MNITYHFNFSSSFIWNKINLLYFATFHARWILRSIAAAVCLNPNLRFNQIPFIHLPIWRTFNVHVTNHNRHVLAAFRFAGQQKTQKWDIIIITITELKCEMQYRWLGVSVSISLSYSRKAAHKQWKMSVKVSSRSCKSAGKRAPEATQVLQSPVVKLK